MGVEIAKATDDDWRDIANVMFDTFLKNEHPYVDAFYPHHDTPTGREVALQRFAALCKADAAGNYMKMVDTDSGKIIGQGRWGVVHPDPTKEYGPSEIKGEYWDTEEDREFTQWCANHYTEGRRKKFRETQRPVFAVTSLTVLPQYEGRGAGGSFIKWGTDQADALGSECIVEAAIRSESFYAKHGFVAGEHVRLVPPKKWQHHGVQEFIWMIRPPQSKREE